MKKRRKAVLVTAATLMLALSSSISALAYTGWVEKSGKWYYYNEDGTKLTNGWVQSGDTWYWINSTGNMSTKRWVEYEGNMYYMQEDGSMARNRFVQYKKDTYYLGPQGYALTNSWVSNDAEDKWYYMNEGRGLTIGFKEIDGDMYYFDGGGVMMRNITLGGYQFGQDGKGVQ